LGKSVCLLTWGLFHAEARIACGEGGKGTRRDGSFEKFRGKPGPGFSPHEREGGKGTRYRFKAIVRENQKY